MNFTEWRVIKYPRKSREDEQREKETGEDCLKIMTDLLLNTCAKLGIPHFEDDIMPEIGSADTIDDRPVFKRILEELIPSGKYNGIAVREISRLGRGNFTDAGRIYDAIMTFKFYIITPYKVYDPTNKIDLKLIRWELFQAREEYESTKDRLWYGRDESAKKGYAGGYLPVLGVVTHRGRFTLVPEEVYLREKILLLRESPLSFQEVANILNSEGKLTKRGKKWSPTSVRQICISKRNLGLAVWNGQEILAQHPPLADVELYNRVQEVNRERSIPSNRKNSPYLVKLYCECGKRMYGWTDKAKTKVSGKWRYYNHKPYYLCDGRRDTPKCAHKVKLADVHDHILRELFNLFREDIWAELVEKFNFDIIGSNLESVLAEKEKTLRAKEGFLVKIDSDYAKGDLSAVLYSKHFEQTTNNIKTLKHEVVELQKKIRQRKTVSISPGLVRKRLQKVLTDWDKLSNDRKKQIIHAFFPRIELSKNGVFTITRRLPLTF